MIKLMGSVCVLAAGVLVRCRQTAEERRYRELLRDLAAAFLAMSDGIRIGNVSLPRLLESAAQNSREEAAAFFVTVQAFCRKYGIGEAWRRGTDLLRLDTGERQILLDAAACLSGDAEQVCRGLNAAAESLRRQLCRRQEQAEDTGKRTAALCLSVPALIVILLI